MCVIFRMLKWYTLQSYVNVQNNQKKTEIDLIQENDFVIKLQQFE